MTFPIRQVPLPPIEQTYLYVFIYTIGGRRHTWCHNSESDWLHCIEPALRGGNGND